MVNGLQAPSVSALRTPDHVHQGALGGFTLGFFQSLSPQRGAILAAGMCPKMGYRISPFHGHVNWNKLDEAWRKCDKASYLGVIHFQTNGHLASWVMQEFSHQKPCVKTIENTYSATARYHISSTKKCRTRHPGSAASRIPSLCARKSRNHRFVMC